MSGFNEDYVAAFRAEMQKPALAHRTHAMEFHRMQSIPLPKAGAKGQFFITPHAVQRYTERYRPGVTYEVALGELITLTSAATRVGTANNGVGEVWRGPRIGPKSKQHRCSRLRFVVMAAANDNGGELPQVVTVWSARAKSC